MHLRVHHRTEYRYPTLVTESVNELRLRPADGRWQTCESSIISVFPPVRLTHYDDLHRNRVHHFEISAPHDRLVVESRATVTTREKVDFERLPYGFLHADLDQCRRTDECHPFLQDSAYVSRDPGIWREALDIQGGSQDVFQTGYAIMEHIFRRYVYRSGSTSVSTHASEVIERKTGVCQDFAHAMIALCRSIGIPARYVSGYFFDATRDQSLRGSEASHAWVEIYIVGSGWIGLDPTNLKVVDATYIVLATGRDYGDVAPVRGVYLGAGSSELLVTVKVERC
jgi:transglutaminase-like putative cysteine protease